MKFTVNQDDCIGCGACESTCPDVFELVDGTSRCKLADVPADLQDCALSAEVGCPVQAISHS